MIAEQSIVVVCLAQPREKYWGRLEGLTLVGVHLRGMDLGMVEEWAREIARGEPPTLGASSLFFPLTRVEKILLDEDVGIVRAVRSSLVDIIGHDAADHL